MPVAAQFQCCFGHNKTMMPVPFIFFFWAAHLFNPKVIARLYSLYNFELINKQRLLKGVLIKPKKYNMKKLTTTVAAIAMLFSATLFAADKEGVKVNESVKASFQKGFLNATHVSWTQKDDVFFASFMFNDRNAEAAFNEKGDLIGLSHSIETNQMPLAISVSIANKYPGFVVSKMATEITYENQTNYYVNLSDGKKMLKIKCAVNGDITVDSKKNI
jgi:hypothetical protein